MNHVHFGTRYTDPQRLLTLPPNVLTLQDGCDLHRPLENSLIWPFPAGSRSLPFPRPLWRFRIAPLLSGE